MQQFYVQTCGGPPVPCNKRRIREYITDGRAASVYSSATFGFEQSAFFVLFLFSFCLHRPREGPEAARAVCSCLLLFCERNARFLSCPPFPSFYSLFDLVAEDERTNVTRARGFSV